MSFTRIAWAWPKTDFDPICPHCNDIAPIGKTGYGYGSDKDKVFDHRWCMVHAFESNTYQKKQDWIDACVEHGRKLALPSPTTRVIARRVKRVVLKEKSVSR
jgi:hypothetical protein